MNRPTLLFMTLAVSLALAASPQALMASGLHDRLQDNPRDISAYVAPEKIAIDPVLLKTEDLGSLDMSLFAPDKNALPSFTVNHTKDISPIETIYTSRLREPIDQFGYDMFPSTPKQGTKAAVQDDYILESGDEVNILIRGGRSLNITTTVTEDGSLIVEDLPPVMAAGKSLRAVREELVALISDIYNTEVFLSVGKTRQMTITITGDVTNPGQVTLGTFNSVMDAIALAGGIKKTGSLRQIKLMRGEKSTFIDLYGILVYGSATVDISLRDGDRILVPPIGPTIAVAGAAKRPAIYEILPANRSLWKNTGAKSQKLSLGDVLDLAGGTLMPSRTRYIRLNVEHKSADDVSQVLKNDNRIFGDGDILLINQSGQDTRSGNIELHGETPHAGLYALGETPTLSALLKNKGAFSPETYPLLGVIERWNEKKLTKEYIAFSPARIVGREDDVDLHESDTITLFSRDEALKIKAREDSNTNNTDDTSANETLSRKLSADLYSFLAEHSVFLRGAVRASGSYPIAPETSLDDLLSVAGGASLEANTHSVEITQPRADKSSQRTEISLSSTPASQVTLHPGDTIRIGQNFRRIEDRHVLLTGEVKNPGTYDLIAGDTLGSLLKRAGGVTEEAYPNGTIFSRKSERKREEQRYKSEAQSLELSLATALQVTETDKKPNAQEIALAKNLIAELKSAEALGRLTIEADPSVLTANPELDILLETGDKIYVPKRPLTVRVAGEVLSPASLQFRSGKTPQDYLNEAGGFTYNADQDRAFVVLPDGSAQPLAVSAWNYKATLIPPGATIIVPRDPKPLGFMDGAKDLSQILANLATTAIFAEDIADGSN